MPTSPRSRLEPPPTTKPWIERLARLGYAAKGIVYLIVGWLTLRAARGSGHAPTGSPEPFSNVGASLVEDAAVPTGDLLERLRPEAMSAVLHHPLGEVALAAIAIGLAGYATWRAVEAIADPERKGNDAKGLAVRAYYLASALFHAWLVVAAVKLIVGIAHTQGQDRTPARTAQVMAHPFGRWAVLLLGVALLGAAVQQVRLALGRYRKKIVLARVPVRARRLVGGVAAAGMLARALVLAIVGTFLIVAAWRERPQEARGLAGALRVVEAQPMGAWLLAIVALGLAAYGVFQLLEARYKQIVK